jgi:orotate phosphoribosyltransferase
MIRPSNLEKTLRDHGAIKIGEFTTRSGLPANCKLEIDDEFLKENDKIARSVAVNLAEQVGEYEPSLIVPVPDGANYLGELIAKHLSISYLAMSKKEDRTYGFRSVADRIHASRISRIGIVDDVYTTGGSLRDISAIPELRGKVVIAGVIWDRSDPAIPKNLEFDLVSVVKRYVPLMVEENATS